MRIPYSTILSTVRNLALDPEFDVERNFWRFRGKFLLSLFPIAVEFNYCKRLGPQKVAIIFFF